MDGLYKDNFENAEDVFGSYGVPDEERQGVNVIYAMYSYEDYLGHSEVLFEKDGKLFEVHGSHCSCYGLEDQWEPKEVTARDWLSISSGQEVDDHVRLWCMINGHPIVAD